MGNARMASPSSHGKSLCWDATVVDTYAKTAIAESAVSPGSAAKKAEERKTGHYEALTARYQFYPVAIETTGVYGSKTERFIKDLGSRMKGRTDEARQSAWLRQWLSVAIARGNASSILATGNFYNDD